MFFVTKFRLLIYSILSKHLVTIFSVTGFQSSFLTRLSPNYFSIACFPSLRWIVAFVVSLVPVVTLGCCVCGSVKRLLIAAAFSFGCCGCLCCCHCCFVAGVAGHALLWLLLLWLLLLLLLLVVVVALVVVAIAVACRWLFDVACCRSSLLLLLARVADFVAVVVAGVPM